MDTLKNAINAYKADRNNRNISFIQTAAKNQTVYSNTNSTAIHACFSVNKIFRIFFVLFAGAAVRTDVNSDCTYTS